MSYERMNLQDGVDNWDAEKVSHLEDGIVANETAIAALAGGDQDIDTTTTTVEMLSEQTNCYLDKNGNVVSFNGFNVARYNVEKFNRIHVVCTQASLTASFLVDAEGNKTMVIDGTGDGNVNAEVDIPAGTVYFDNTYRVGSSYVTPVVTNKSYIPGDITVDQEYNPESQNPQSGIAVAQAIAAAFPEAAEIEIEPESVQNQAFIDSSLATNTTTGGYTVCQILKYPVTVGETIRVVCTSASLCYSCWTSADGTRTKAFGGTMASYDIDAEYEVPSGAAYFELSCRNDSGDPAVYKKSSDPTAVVVQLQNQLKGQFKGKKIGIIGDSIAVGERLGSSDKNFITVFAESVGASGVKNAAIGGWDYCDQDNHGIYRQVDGLSGTSTSLDGDEDLVIIFAGTNDYGHESPLGKAWTLEEHSEGNKIKKATTDTYATTFCGGIHKTVETLWAKYGYVPIVMCTPLHRNYPSTSAGYPDTSHWANNEGLYIDDYIEAIEKVASFYGIPVFNSYRLTGLYPMNAALNEKYFADGIHPNAAGHKVLGEALANFVKQLYLPLK